MSMSDRSNGVVSDRTLTVSKKLVALAKTDELKKTQEGDTVYVPASARAIEKPSFFDNYCGSCFKSIYLLFHPNHQSRQEVAAIKIPQEKKTTSPSYRSLSVTNATSEYGNNR